ncbi:GNAT family N-acetyltransferase [Roseovarius sp. SCSIO 43702]|uniref:GNAT family N-acetyltransferase n=1 Tax=Roseovarius sp. SCSIO 43702 TaxID=2823043 RepID=UPI001C72D46A|nr:GNAT family N-acetyltransferase [Roseovarius sp. SCSIO 43702]QYX57624.1 GNAT family N-acetyltransferase [Roseovarius sp. SCSIO 43702]
MIAFTIEPGIPRDARIAAAWLYWEAFGGKLGRVMGPDKRARRFFAMTFDARFALSALAPDGTLLGIAGFKTHEGSMTGGSFAEMAAIYGAFGAGWRAACLSLLEREVLRDVLLMDGICVAPAARGQGVGSALLDAVIAEAAARGLPAVRLDVIDDNPRARALYERKGFRATHENRLGLLRHVFGFTSATAMLRDVGEGAP